MTGYLTAEAAREDGFTISHREGEHRFVVEHEGEVVGYAQYTLMGVDGINFDSTFMNPKHRGSGLSALLVGEALADDIVSGRNVMASCWYVADYLKAQPDALAPGATYTGR